MDSQTDPHRDIQQQIAGQIGALAAALPRCAIMQVIEGVDDIRRLARDHGFALVETLASRLESAVAADGHRAAILPWLDAMSDAAAAPCGPIPAAAHEAWLAAVATRLGN